MHVCCAPFTLLAGKQRLMYREGIYRAELRHALEILCRVLDVQSGHMFHSIFMLLHHTGFHVGSWKMNIFLLIQ